MYINLFNQLIRARYSSYLETNNHMRVHCHVQKGHNWSKFRVTWPRSTSSCTIPVRSILILSSHLSLRLQFGVFPSGLPVRAVCSHILSSLICYRNNWWWRLKIMKLISELFIHSLYAYINNYMINILSNVCKTIWTHFSCLHALVYYYIALLCNSQIKNNRNK